VRLTCLQRMVVFAHNFHLLSCFRLHYLFINEPRTKFDFFFRLYWTDTRFSLPGLYEALPDWISSDGIELRDMCVSPKEEPGGCDFWVPHMLVRLHPYPPNDARFFLAQHPSL
jgi:hypothetical protein